MKRPQDRGQDSEDKSTGAEEEAAPGCLPSCVSQSLEEGCKGKGSGRFEKFNARVL